MSADAAFVETAALLAIMNGDVTETEDLVSTMLPSELVVFYDQVAQLLDVVRDARRRDVEDAS